VSVPGARRAPPIDQVSHNRKTTTITATRRIQKRRRVGRLAWGRRVGGCSGGVPIRESLRVVITGAAPVASPSPLRRVRRKIAWGIRKDPERNGAHVFNAMQKHLNQAGTVSPTQTHPEGGLAAATKSNVPGMREEVLLALEQAHNYL